MNKATKQNQGININLSRNPIADQCEGCERIEELEGKKFCKKYVEPSYHWEDEQICSFATHIKKEVKIIKKIVNPLKASKRAAGKK